MLQIIAEGEFCLLDAKMEVDSLPSDLATWKILSKC